MACIIPENKTHQELVERFNLEKAEQILSQYFTDNSDTVTIDEIINHPDVIEQFIETEENTPLGDTTYMSHSEKIRLFNKKFI